MQSIRRIPEVPLSVLLSGGIDSSLVLALLRRVYPGVSISTFTLAKSKNYPDMVFARKIADLFETEHNEIIISNEEYSRFLDVLVWISEDGKERIVLSESVLRVSFLMGHIPAIW